jgi:hypothetical protein
MRSKGKLLALVAIFAAVALITGTGAFSTVEAERTADVNVAGDSSALLQLEPAGNGYLIDNQSDEIAITLASNTQNPSGVNQNATTTVNRSDFLKVTNNGANEVELGIQASTSSNVDVYFVVGSGSTESSSNSLEDLDGGITSGSVSTFNPSEKYPIQNNTVAIGSGGTVNVGIVIDVGDVGGDTELITDDITITAEAT